MNDKSSPRKGPGETLGGGRVDKFQNEEGDLERDRLLRKVSELEKVVSSEVQNWFVNLNFKF